LTTLDPTPVKSIRALRSLLLIPVLVAWISACASSRFPGQGPSALVRVNNEHSTLSHLTIYLVPSLGTPVRLGTVESNRTRDFRIRRGQLTGNYRLWARVEGGNSFYSPEFTLSDRDVWEWDLRMNQLFRTGVLTG